MLVVERVPQGVEGLLPSRRRDIQALPGLQVTPRRQHMHMDPASRLPMQHRRPGIALLFEPCPGRALELVQRLLDLVLARLVLRRPGDHSRGVAVLELQAVGYLRHPPRIPPQHLDLFPLLPGRVPLLQQVLGRRPRRSRSPGEELNVHLSLPPCGPRTARPVPARWPTVAPPPPPRRLPACRCWPSAQAG